jgi:hypothetical protein
VRKSSNVYPQRESRMEVLPAENILSFHRGATSTMMRFVAVEVRRAANMELTSYVCCAILSG